MVDKKINAQKSGFWDVIEPNIVTVGKWAWIWPLIYAGIYIFLTIWPFYVWVTAYGLSGSDWWGPYFLWFVYDVIYIIIAIIFTFVYVKPYFSNKCANKEWQWLVDDVFYFGSTRVPKMLVIGIILEILGRGYGGVTIIGPAIAIILWAPVKINWHGSKPSTGKTTNKVKTVTKSTPKVIEKDVEKKKPTTTTTTKSSSTTSKPTSTATTKSSSTTSKPTSTTKTSSKSSTKSSTKPSTSTTKSSKTKK